MHGDCEAASNVHDFSVDEALLAARRESCVGGVCKNQYEESHD